MNFREIPGELLWRLSHLLPIQKNAVLFSSYCGKGYSGSPKAIAEALLSSDEKVKLYWIVNSEAHAATLPEGVTPVYQSQKMKRILAHATSKVWVDNCRKYVRYKRNGQYYMQTWHGFALKRIEADVAENLEDAYVKFSKQDSAFTDLVVSGSEFMSKIYRNSFWYPEDVEIRMFGTPRNDIFFKDCSEISEKIRKSLRLPADRKLALYAPTFRADHNTECYQLDAARLKSACEKRFGGNWSVLIRLHPNISDKSASLFPYDGDGILDATAYPDMQELLAGVDLLLTDYSSSMFDYALSGKSCIQFATDIEDYRKDRNFYFSLDSLPFPMAQSNDELENIILDYDTQLWQDRWNEFRNREGIHIQEDGGAARRCAAWILEKLGRDI